MKNNINQSKTLAENIVPLLELGVKHNIGYILALHSKQLRELKEDINVYELYRKKKFGIADEIKEYLTILEENSLNVKRKEVLDTLKQIQWIGELYYFGTPKIFATNDGYVYGVSYYLEPYLFFVPDTLEEVMVYKLMKDQNKHIELVGLIDDDELIRGCEGAYALYNIDEYEEVLNKDQYSEGDFYILSTDDPSKKLLIQIVNEVNEQINKQVQGKEQSLRDQFLEQKTGTEAYSEILSLFMAFFEMNQEYQEVFDHPEMLVCLEQEIARKYNFVAKHKNTRWYPSSMEDDFEKLVRLVEEYLGDNSNINLGAFTWYILQDAACHFFFNKWEEKFEVYFESCKGNELDEYLNAYVDIPNDVEGRSMGEFTYYLMHKNLLEQDDFIKSLDKVRNILVPMIDKKKEEDEFERFKKKLKGAKKKNVVQYTIDDTDLMDGVEFEEFLAKLLKQMGYRVEKTKTSGDQGIDLIGSRLNKKIGIQAKCYSSKVGNKAIQEVVAGLKVYGCDKGIVITNNYFTAAAQELARANGILLWDRDSLEERIDRYLN